MKQVLIYIIYILCTSILAFFIRKKKNIFNYLFLLIIIIIWSTYTLVWSYEIIGDRLNYVMWFQRIYPIYSNNLNLIFQQNNEYGWVFFNSILCRITSNEKIALLIYMFFPILISIIIMYKQKVNFYKLHFLFSVTLIPYYCTYLSRQMFAYGFGMLAIYSYINSKKIISLLFVILAMLFHKSAVVILLAILLFEFITSKKKIIILALVSILSLPFLPIIISLTFTIFNINKWQINNNMIFTIAILKSIPYLIIFYLGLKNYNVLKKDNNLNIYLIMTFLSGFFWITTSLGTWYYRLNIYFLFGVIMLMFNELKLIKGKKDYLILLVSIYLIFFITLREIYLMSLY